MATGATEFIDNTTADVFLPEIWSSLAIIAREQATVFAALADRRFEEGIGFGDVVHVPSVTNLAAQTKTLASNAAIVFETQTETNTDITINRWIYSAIAVEDIMKVQGNRDFLELYAGKMGYALALEIDDFLAGLPDDFTNAVGTLAVGLSDTDYIRAIQYLDDANAPMTTRYFVIAPAEQSNLLAMDKFVHNDYSSVHGGGPRELAVEHAYMRSFYTIPVYKTTNVEGTNAAGHDNTLFQKESIALVVQMTPEMHAMYDINYLTSKVALENVYGAREMRDDHGVFMRGA